MHGFDEFFGNLYHLNAEEDPEMESYQAEKDIPGFKEKFGPRGILRSWATEEDDPTEEPRWGRVGKQRIGGYRSPEPQAHRNRRRRIRRGSDGFHETGNRLNTSHMHFITHPKPESKGKAGRWQSDYHDTMVDHDELISRVLAYLDELGIGAMAEFG